MKRNRALASVGVVLATLASSPAFAEKPIRTSQAFDFTVLAPFTSAQCGFDVYQRIVGTFTVTAIQRDGMVVKEIDGAHHASVTWFAPSQGTSYSFPLNSPTTFLYPDGAYVGAPALLYFFGLSEKIPGAGATAGQAVYEGTVVQIDADGIPLVVTDAEPIRVTGHIGGDVQARCAALSAP